MLKHQVGPSDIPSTQLLVEAQLLGLWSSSGNQWSPVIQEECLKTLQGPVKAAKKNQFPSNLTLFGAWLLLFITVAAMLAPISTSWGQESYSNQIVPEESGFTLPE
ncbi:hypothetical protein [Laspinema olomoucense]|uniref:Uncharacterized protein n=1 Tax=Laspinema olomoucense D3b TaxID=2953688 RepID=A0ABT2N0D5_9CYAN|nr:hypothetical protein [Laspinema sp. D3b]MCT7976132.1 hypothetical protein [Laspinema sp. D3b]